MEATQGRSTEKAGQLTATAGERSGEDASCLINKMGKKKKRDGWKSRGKYCVRSSLTCRRVARTEDKAKKTRFIGEAGLINPIAMVLMVV